MRRKQMKRLAAAVCAAVLCLIGTVSPALADGFATYGNAQGDTTFYVSATGAATITMTQSGMGLAEKQYAYQSSSTASEYVYAQYTVQYKGTQDAYWQQSTYWNGEKYTLNLPRADVYTVRVLPTSIQNIATSQQNWRYTRWITVPAWYVSGVRNCGVYSSYPANAQPVYRTATPRPTSTPVPYGTTPVTLYFWDVSGFHIESPEVQYLTPGSHPVRTTRTVSQDYTLVGVTANIITVSYAGVANPAAVHLLYRKKAASNTSSITGRKTVTPYYWDTQYKEGTSEKNAKWGKELPNLYDNKRSTTFKWTVWTSEWKDDIPEITAYFNGQTVGAIGIRNGDASSETNYYSRARATQWRVRVWNQWNQYQDTLVDMNDVFSTDYQVVPLSQTYSNVSRIEIFLVRYTKGSTYANGLYISDMLFFEN